MMKGKWILIGAAAAVMTLSVPAYCSSDVQEVQETVRETELEDGVYTAVFDTDSSMFHLNEACDKRAELTVKDGKMTIHLIMPSKNIVNLFLGLAEDAQKDGAQLIEPAEEEVTYSDGMKETVYAFDVEVPMLEEEFDLALIGTKGKWYDHKVKIADVQPAEDVK